MICARNAAMAASPSWPLSASAAMFSCCSTIVAPAAAHATDKGDDAEVSRLQQQMDRLASADARFVLDLRCAADRMASADHDDNGQASAEGDRTHQQEVRRADAVDDRS